MSGRSSDEAPASGAGELARARRRRRRGVDPGSAASPAGHPLAGAARSRPPPTLSDYAYARIAAALISGRFRPGEKLTLRGLSDRLGISSTPIRDAIRQLSAENAIDFVPNRHIRVPVLTAEQLRELRDIRMALEGLAVERAALHADPAAIVQLRELHARIIGFRDAGDIPATVEHIQKLHFFIYGLPRMDHLFRLIEACWLRTAPYVSLLFPDYSLRERGNLRGMVIDALERRDPGSARRFIEADICGAMDFIIGRAHDLRRDDRPGVAGR